MRSAVKVTISFFLSLLLAGTLFILSSVGVFKGLEIRLYRQSVLNRELSLLDYAKSQTDDYYRIQNEKLTLFMESGPFTTVYEQDQSRGDISERDRLIQRLGRDVPGFQSLVVIDRDLQRIHYSSLTDDVTIRNNEKIVYNNWSDSVSFNEAFHLYETENENESYRVFIDGDKNKFVYAQKAYDAYGLFRGTSLFIFTLEGLKNRLIDEGLLSNPSLFQAMGDKGFVIGLSDELKAISQSTIKESWNDGIPDRLISLAKDDNQETVSLISRDGNIYFGKIVHDDNFRLPLALLILFYLILFISLFLLLLLSLNVKQDSMTVLHGRLKKFQLNFLKDWLDNRELMEWSDWERELQTRKNEYFKEFLRQLKMKKPEEEIKGLLEKNWQDIVDILFAHHQKQKETSSPSIDMEELEKMIKKALESVQINTVPAAPASSVNISQPSPSTAGSPFQGMKPVSVESVDDLDVADDQEGLEELDDAEELGEVEELDDLEDVEELGEVEELDVADDQEGLEELDELEEVEELGDVEELDELEDVEELGEVDELEEVEELDAVDDQQGLEELDKAGARAAVASDDLSSSHVEEAVDEPEDIYEELSLDDLEIQHDSIEELPVAEPAGSAEELEEVANIEQSDYNMFEVRNDMGDNEGFDGELEQVDDLDELEELEELEDLEELDEEMDSAIFDFSIEEALTKYDSHSPLEISDADEEQLPLESEHNIEIDSLISVKSEGLLPDVSFEEDGFLFTETNRHELPLISQGYDFDRFRKGYMDNERGYYKALLDYSRGIEAQCAVILSEDDEGLFPILSIGMNRTPEGAIVHSDSLLFSKYLSKRSILGIDGAKNSEILGDKWDWIAFKYVNSLLFLPLIFKRKKRYLMLGFKETSANPQELIFQS